MKKLSAVKLLFAIVMLVLVTASLVGTITRKTVSKTAQTTSTIVQWILFTLITVFELKEQHEKALLEEAVEEVVEEEF